MFTLPDLPYAYDALEPTMSAETLKLHHDKHHASYIEKANDLAKKANLADLALEDLIDAARGTDKKLFNNAAQAWNHDFFWHSMTADYVKPDGAMADAIAASFGDLAKLRTEFVTQGAGHFGSGWVWLMADKSGNLSVANSHDADNPVGKGGPMPLLVCDLWEHAYYVDKRNDRKAYLEVWFDRLANWDFAARQLNNAVAGRVGYQFPETVPAD